jgi:O-antigen ligase
LRTINVREISIAFACAAGAAAGATLLAALSSHAIHTVSELVVAKNVPAIVPSVASTEERLTSILGGLKLFVEHPIFGAGLGAFRNQMIFVSNPEPLLIHSTAVWLLAELGIVGLLVFAIPAAYVFANEWVHARKEQASVLIVLCFIAFAVMATPADMLYQRTFWLVVGAGLAVVRRR